MNVMSLMNLMNKLDIKENYIMDIQNVVERGTNNKFLRVMFEKRFSKEEKDKLAKQKTIKFVGDASYKYAPEIVHSYIVIKG